MGASDDRILRLAAERNLLSESDLQTLTDSAGNGCDRAIEQNLLTLADVEVLRPLAEGETFLPGYEILELVGKGAAGAVYRARQTKLDRIVALKILRLNAFENSTASARSQLEAQVGASLQHPNIVTVHDYGVHQQRIFLALEYIDGETLLDRIERQGPFDLPLSLHIARQVTSALDYATTQDVVHRDIKPANLLLAHSAAGHALPPGVPLVKVTDFGLAQRRRTDEMSTRLTADGATLGTPSYVAPEQLRDTNVDHRADIFALGVTIYHMLTGKQPYAGSNAILAIAEKLEGRQTWRDAIETEILGTAGQLVLDMTHKETEKRVSSYAELDERLKELLAKDVPTTKALESVETEAVSPRAGVPRRIQAILLTLLVAIVGIGTAVLMTQSRSQSPKGLNAASAVETDNLPKAQRVRVVEQRQLFRGDGMPFSRQLGQWNVDTDAEGAPVLAGTNGWKRFAIPAEWAAQPFFEFGVSANPIDSAVSEIGFAVTISDESAADSVPLEKKNIAILGLNSSSAKLGTGSLSGNVPFEPNLLFEPVAFQPGSADAPRYQAVTIQRQPTGWFVRVNGERLGTIPATNEQDLAIYLRATNGTVHFDDLSVSRLALR